MTKKKYKRKCTIYSLATFCITNNLNPDDAVILIRQLEKDNKVIHAIDKREFEFIPFDAWVLPFNEITKHLK